MLHISNHRNYYWVVSSMEKINQRQHNNIVLIKDSPLPPYLNNQPVTEKDTLIGWRKHQKGQKNSERSIFWVSLEIH